MKHNNILVALFLIGANCFAQSKQIAKADALFNSYQYAAAIPVYMEVIESYEVDTEVYAHLADAYYNTNQKVEAAKWYEQAVKGEQEAELYFRYAQSLKTAGNYREADEQMKKFASLNPEDIRAKNYTANPNYLNDIPNSENYFEVGESILNSEEGTTEFAAVGQSNGTVYFTSNRLKKGKKDNWSESPYLDIYSTTVDEEGNYSDPTPVEELNTPYHDGPVTLSADGTVMIFSRDGHSSGISTKTKGAKIAQQGLYRAELIDGKWQNITALPFNSDAYSVSHPSLSVNGDYLYFASNMPGGYGQTDIWRVSVNGDSYGTPENLGPKVNTPGKEGFPFINGDNELYFASTGRLGLGGFDLFKVDLDKNEDSVNLGNGINSKSDDFALSINPNSDQAYFSSNRSGTDRIYEATKICKYTVGIEVISAVTNRSISDAKIVLINKADQKIQNSEASGSDASFKLSCNQQYLVTVNKEGFKSKSLEFTDINGEDQRHVLELEPTEELIKDEAIVLNDIYFEFDKSDITPEGAKELDKLVDILKTYTDIDLLVKSHTDAQGKASYNLKLSEARALSTMNYLIEQGIAADRLQSKGMGAQEPLIDCGAKCSDEENAKNRRSEFLIVK